MEIDATRMCRLLVGLPTVNVIGIVDLMPAVPIVVNVETLLEDGERCAACGTGDAEGPRSHHPLGPPRSDVRADVRSDRVARSDLQAYRRRARQQGPRVPEPPAGGRLGGDLSSCDHRKVRDHAVITRKSASLAVGIDSQGSTTCWGSRSIDQSVRTTEPEPTSPDDPPRWPRLPS